MTKRSTAASRTATEALPDHLVVGELNFAVHRSGVRRSIGITVDRDGALIVNAPTGCAVSELAAFAHDKRMWVYKKLAEKDLLLSHRPKKEFVTGEGFAYLGRSHRLLLVRRQSIAVKLERGRFAMARGVAISGHGAQAITAWYQTRALRWLPKRVEPWATRMGASPTAVDVRDLGYRWGSLGKHDRLNFHWATIQLPPTLIDYVIVHEVAHISEPNHTQQFWDRVERAMPSFRQVKAELARIGSSLWLGDGDAQPPITKHLGTPE
jgi:predicted metal-dependent hydrolase